MRDAADRRDQYKLASAGNGWHAASATMQDQGGTPDIDTLSKRDGCQCRQGRQQPDLGLCESGIPVGRAARRRRASASRPKAVWRPTSCGTPTRTRATSARLWTSANGTDVDPIKMNAIRSGRRSPRFVQMRDHDLVRRKLSLMPLRQLWRAGPIQTSAGTAVTRGPAKRFRYRHQRPADRQQYLRSTIPTT